MSKIQIETEVKICDLYMSGFSSYKIAKETGVSATQIRRILTKNNIKGKSNKIYYYLSLNKENSIKLSNIISKYTIDCMKYKIIK